MPSNTSIARRVVTRVRLRAFPAYLLYTDRSILVLSLMTLSFSEGLESHPRMTQVPLRDRYFRNKFFSAIAFFWKLLFMWSPKKKTKFRNEGNFSHRDYRNRRLWRSKWSLMLLWSRHTNRETDTSEGMECRSEKNRLKGNLDNEGLSSP
jgi:hypothetical protein